MIIYTRVTYSQRKISTISASIKSGTRPFPLFLIIIVSSWLFPLKINQRGLLPFRAKPGAPVDFSFLDSN